MSGTSDADVKITLTADDQASTTVSSATATINQQFRAMSQTQNAAGRSFLVSNQGLYAYGRAAQSVGRITDKSISLFNSYNLMQIRISQATQTNTDAQEALAEAIAQYGANSPQAQKASKDAAKAQTDLSKATQQAQIQFALMIASSVAQSGTLITTVIPRLKSLASVLGTIGGGAAGGGALSTVAKTAAGVAGGAAGGGALSTVAKTAAGVAGGAGTAAASTVAGGGIAGIAAKLGTAALRVAPTATGAAAAVSLLSMMGSQQAGETSVPTGLDALKQIGNDITQALTNPNSPQAKNMQNTWNIIVQDAGAAANTVQNELSKVSTFFGGTQ